MRNTKRKYGMNMAWIILIILAVSIAFGFLFDLVYTQIEYLVYPKPDEYKAYVEKYSEEYGIDEDLVWAVIKTESGFDSSAVSSDGAIGLMQMTPETFEWLTKDKLREDLDSGMLYDPETNVKYGTYYLSAYLYAKFGDWDTALTAYIGGENRVANWLKDSRYSDDGVTLKIDELPSQFKMTKDYAKKVNKALDKYKSLY